MRLGIAALFLVSAGLVAGITLDDWLSSRDCAGLSNDSNFWRQEAYKAYAQHEVK